MQHMRAFIVDPAVSLSVSPQAMQHMRARLATEIEAASLMVYNTARLKDSGLPYIKEAAMTKYYTSEVCVCVCVCVRACVRVCVCVHDIMAHLVLFLHAQSTAVIFLYLPFTYYISFTRWPTMLLLVVLRCWVVWDSSKILLLKSSIETPRLVRV